MTTALVLDSATVFEALVRLEGKAASGELAGQIEQFDWNPGWVHGFAARDVAAELRSSFGFPQSLGWSAVLPFLKRLACRDVVSEVKVGKGYRRKPVPLYRTVGG